MIKSVWKCINIIEISHKRGMEQAEIIDTFWTYHPTSSIGELFSSYVHPLHGNPYSSHHICYLAFSPMIFLIDVSLSHPICLPPPPYSLFAILSVNSRSYSHPLHECSKYRKGVDQIDLYLAS